MGRGGNKHSGPRAGERVANVIASSNVKDGVRMVLRTGRRRRPGEAVGKMEFKAAIPTLTQRI